MMIKENWCKKELSVCSPPKTKKGQRGIIYKEYSGENFKCCGRLVDK
jgi:hypothetical protein